MNKKLLLTINLLLILALANCGFKQKSEAVLQPNGKVFAISKWDYAICTDQDICPVALDPQRFCEWKNAHQANNLEISANRYLETLSPNENTGFYCAKNE